ncbi:MAG TPA: mechanosensitive ion channel family protein [Gammaproteobacteria bacterium]|nr:mechanosensitive ion channel family protein [Gammaproteobacteria bacterium]
MKDLKLFGHSVETLGLSLVLFAVVLLVVVLFKRVLLGRLAAFARRTENTWDDHLVDVLDRTSIVLFLPLALYVGSTVLNLPRAANGLLASIAIAGILLQVASWFDRIIVSWLHHMATRWDPARATTMSMMGIVVRVLLWTMLAFVALDTFGINITALVAGLGIGGVAVALAAQNILGDLFASLSIVFDSPFLIGDFIVVDDKMGTVEHIGIKTTRIRSLGGEQVVFSNSDLLKSRIRNYKRMFERRVVFSIGVTYQTPADKLAAIPDMIREIICSLEKTRFDRSHFSQFGDFALVIETVYFVLDPDYNFYMDVHQKIGLEILKRFEREGIEFAYPTQTIQLQQAAG